MKKLGIIFASLVLSLNLGLIDTFAYNRSIQISINNEIVTPTQAPIIVNSRTMVPIRFISEELGYNVQWDKNKNVYIYDDTTTLETFDNATDEVKVFLNNSEIYFPDQKPIIIKSSTFIPLKAVADNMNVTTTWNGDQKLVSIYTNETPIDSTDSSNNSENIFYGYTKYDVYGGDTSGYRRPNAVVDIGFGDREYFGFTNEYGQLVKVVADNIILQDSDTEELYGNGRYYPDEAKVPGTELKNYDEGHVIADSLGGVANAYNITPQQSTLNRHGNQAYMEKSIRDAGGATNFVAIITYPNTTTQIPSHYSYTYTLNGNIINDEFDNLDPDAENQSISDLPTSNSSSIEETPSFGTVVDTNTELSINSNLTEGENTSDFSKYIYISSLDKVNEFITITNRSDKAIDLTGFTILSVRGNQSFTFPSYTLKPNSSVKVGDSGRNTDITFHWLDQKGTWNNQEYDPAKLFDSNGNLVSLFDDK